MSYIRFAPSSGSTDPFYHRRATCAPSSCRPSSRPSSGPSFNPIADILSALESEFTGTKSQPQAQQPKRPTTTPHFDVVETEDAYILEGELPGVSDKRSIDIQFSDAQTLVVKGEIKKKSHDQKRQQDIDDLVASEVSEFVADQQEEKVDEDKSTSSAESVRSLKTTVEETIDESESGSENEFEVVDSPSTLYKGKSKAASIPTTQAADKPITPTPSEPEKSIDNQRKEEPSTKKSPSTSSSNHKYWISERSAGDFARSFTFQSLIDQDAVKATLEHGILEIVVPKRQPYVRRVQIQ